ncbi:hypothetical protein [Longimicrobium sp.]|uniref:hypothetical protein n=1 Tax=Longimicrobium sp. TaxID=2029185 RepID=UPI002CEDC676|nr:hypothetical protein [Longimicrobium sp.]HSU13413.1 hypothetical protein [Longimicrobium sp.]
MRAVFPAFGALIAIAAAGALAACGDPFGGLDVALRTDSVTLAAVSSPFDLPTALDLVTNNAPAQPELPTEAGDWDFQVRTSGAGFVLHPNPGIAPYRAAGLALTTRDFDDPGPAPRSSDAYTRTDVAITAGQTYFVQSRQRNNICGTLTKFGILKVLSVRADSGIVHLVVKSNQNCDDERLD